MLFQAEEVLRLIPQRAPIVMVDRLLDADGDMCHTGLSVSSENYFIETDGKLAETGLIEHIAQSASAFAGYRYLLKNLPAPIGYIGEIKNFVCMERPAIGAELTTDIVFEAEAEGITLMSGKTSCEGRPIASTRMKIFVEPA